MIKAIIVDLDGTLLDHNGNVSALSAEMLKKAKSNGILPIIATGRNYAETEFAAERIGADDLLILLTGSLIIRGNGKVVASYPISQEDGNKIIDILHKRPFYTELYSKNDLYIEKIERIRKVKLPERYVSLVLNSYFPVSDYRIVSENVHKFLVISDNEEMLLNARREMEKIDGILVTSSTANGIEVVKRGVNKGLGLNVLCSELNISADEVAVIGDSENDTDIFRSAGLKIAMGNATGSLKAMADLITKDNEHDGVAYAVNYILNRMTGT